MKTIWKQELDVVDFQKVWVPEGARFLYVANQYEKLCIWYECDSTVVAEDCRVVAIVGTGHPLPENYNYLGSVLMAQGNLVWHVLVK